MKTTKTKTFDTVTESRRWKAAVTRQTAGMSRAELLEFFNKPRSTATYASEPGEETCILREEPPK